MAPERHIFNLTGPSFLDAVDWNNFHHRSSVAASLVKGVYTLERDREQNRHGPQALAPPWWRSFNFRLEQVLVDKHDSSYFGAVFEYIGQSQSQRPPRFVIAFRGTINNARNLKQDYKLNLHLMFNNLQNSSRLRMGLKTACRFVQDSSPAGDVWLAGHSLGSSLALVVGRHMVKHYGAHLHTYLFNPPFISPPFDRLSDHDLKLGLRLVNSVLTAALAAALNFFDDAPEDDHFEVLSAWVPNLFVNPSDPICSEYVGYFKHREDMESIGAGRIGRLATKHSLVSLVSSAFGKEHCEAVHLIPSADLTLNLTPSHNFKEAHGIYQWWRQDLQFDHKHYQYN